MSIDNPILETTPQEFSLETANWKGITLTAAAANQINQISGTQHLHLSVKPSGCTGYAYELKLIDSPSDDDLMFESNGAVIYVALKAIPFMDGTEIDFKQQGLNQSFTYDNPNVKSVCGCGESFGV
ncbi:iron-sulfur cluster assembly accessory protein [Vibrio sp. HA2012]|uniref:iron-sulfur cluster assembly accessory protein n=1 Tax=Vibrio sp. HA2012 TaxID=1971595 RepID=UPI000C2CD086|nr:iron-sulfur cluster assembly accessory protein [Vibrio sp. HA2012]PJC87724.1 iron-sulfur cluster assembly accessory protein [Vibrio sp. HA2012]